MARAADQNGWMNLLQEFSIPLIAGVLIALFSANVAPDDYAAALHWTPFGPITIFGELADFHFLVNDIFMVFFFGIAAKEIAESCLPGGSLNPLRSAVAPLISTLGGVVGPVIVFFAGLWLCFQTGFYTPADDVAQLQRGWGIPTATDIALAWLVARSVFGKGHPAIAFLLLLAVADDAIGLVIIAGFYGDPAHPAAPGYLGLVLLAMALAYGMRRARVMSWLPYVFVCGPIAWSGLMLAHLHPALALAVIVPFMPGPSRDTGLFVDSDEVDEAAPGEGGVHSPLHLFEHQLKGFVDFGLFFFAFANAGVQFASIGAMTWLVLGALVVGKTVGITLCGWLSARLGFALPEGMSFSDLVMAGFVAALGLTVALFVATAAFAEPVLQGQAKMGALFSGLVGFVAIALSRLLGIGREVELPDEETLELPQRAGAHRSPTPMYARKGD